MNEAVQMVNRAFKRCRFLVECTGGDSIVSIETAPPALPSGTSGGTALSRDAAESGSTFAGTGKVLVLR